MTHALLSGGAAFLLALIAGRPLVAWLRAQRLGKAISAEGPSTHTAKEGTPTMGGLLIFGAAAVVTVFTNLFDRLSILLPLLAVGVALAIGAVDDRGTLSGRHQRGLSWRVKFGLIALLGVGIAWACYDLLDAHSVNIPWAGKHDLGLLYVPLAVLIVLTTTASVAITDGLDGLLGGTAAIAFTAYAVIAFAQEQAYLSTFSFTVVGALLGFLWYNAHPASVFMGDTGALPLGAALATVALMTGHWLLLPVIGIVFCAEALSTLLQIAYFQTTGGRRLFRMTPLHHHFELLGWSEPQVVLRFWLFGFAGAMVGVALALAV
ncbi:MAG: phospho-N-acetylmuramoyl-pentapeptide-transferase [Chloroflexi bacterium]|nr:phospho-N-acetylmuramoyl-pentapeptide-transferase [Chloroflexota bacterium]